MALQDELDRLYAARFPPADHLRRTALWKTLCGAFFSSYVRREDVVLDLGAGYCDFINNITAGRRIAVDLNPDTAAHANSEVEVHHISLRSIGTVIGSDAVDVAFASNVFEHLRSPEELLDVLKSVRSTLRPGGTLLVLQPNVRCVGAAFYDFVDHTLPLTEKGMAEALTLSGFEVVESRARFLPYTTKSRIPQWSILVRVYLAFPPAQWIMGKQMFIVARRPL